MTSGWMHSANAIHELLADSGTMVISMHGVEQHLPAIPPGGPATYSAGALQCQIGGHTSLTAFSPYYYAEF